MSAGRSGAAAAVGIALVSFYATYLAYRNLKAIVPFLRPDDLFDRQLARRRPRDVPRPRPRGPAARPARDRRRAHLLSTFYAAFIVFLPLSLGLALVFSHRLQLSLFYAAALSINWVLGAATYFLIPALGPIYASRSGSRGLPHSEATHLQQMLLDDRTGFLADPTNGTPQAIAAFASLHVAMSFTALLGAHLLGLGRWLKIVLWAWLVLTLVATVYLGWHYVVDDIAGVALGVMSLVLRAHAHRLRPADGGHPGGGPGAGADRGGALRRAHGSRQPLGPLADDGGRGVLDVAVPVGGARAPRSRCPRPRPAGSAGARARRGRAEQEVPPGGLGERAAVAASAGRSPRAG